MSGGDETTISPRRDGMQISNDSFAFKFIGELGDGRSVRIVERSDLCLGGVSLNRVKGWMGRRVWRVAGHEKVTGRNRCDWRVIKKFR